MARWLKEGIDPDIKQKADAQVRKTVEDILEDIDARGDAAVRDLSEKFDKWSPESYRLSRDEIDACYKELDEQAISDIRFAQGHSPTVEFDSTAVDTRVIFYAMRDEVEFSSIAEAIVKRLGDRWPISVDEYDKT